CSSPAPDETNIARLASLRMGCGDRVPAWTVQRNCASGLQALDCASVEIALGRADLVLAGGVDAMSRAPLLLSDDFVEWLSAWRNAGAVQRLRLLRRLYSSRLAPATGLERGLNDPAAGLLQGQVAEDL